MSAHDVPSGFTRIAIVFGSPIPMPPYFLARYVRGSDWKLEGRSVPLRAINISRALDEASSLLGRSGDWIYAGGHKGLPDGYLREVAAAQ